MNDDSFQAYDSDLTALLEAVWGEGFMSPGGTAEVDRYLQGIDLAGLSVLDIGCGLGGVDIHLAKRHRAGKVTGIDIEPDLIRQCRDLADKRIYPAIDLSASATRKEELLLDDDALRISHAMRRQLAGVAPADAMLELLGAMRKTQSNRELIDFARGR